MRVLMEGDIRSIPLFSLYNSQAFGKYQSYPPKVKPKVHTIRFMRPCVTCVYQKSRISVVVCDNLHMKTHRMHPVALLSTFLWDSCIAGKNQQFFKLRDDLLGTLSNVSFFSTKAYFVSGNPQLISDLTNNSCYLSAERIWLCIRLNSAGKYYDITLKIMVLLQNVCENYVRILEEQKHRQLRIFIIL